MSAPPQGRGKRARFEGGSGVCGASRLAVLLATIAVLSACGGHTGQDSSSPPSFAAPRGYATGGDPRSVAIGDLNGDDKPDLATGNLHANTVSVLVNRGDSSFRAKLDHPTGRSPVSVAIGDLNGDGKADLATANSEANTVSVLVNRGDGSFQAKRDYPTGRVPKSVAIGDLNGDGKPDL